MLRPEQEQIKKIIEQLELVKELPRSWVLDSRPAIWNWLEGFSVALSALGISRQEFVDAAIEECGWTPYLSLSPIKEMIEKELSVEAIKSEMLRIEIIAWKKALQALNVDEANPSAPE